MSTTTTLLLAIALPLIGFSQNENSSEGNPRKSFKEEQPIQNIESSISSTETNQIELVSSNAVSSSITVHTYKYFGNDVSNVEYHDIDQNTSATSDTQSITDLFLSIEEVTRCTFDQATQTFTILSGPKTDLSVIVNQINNK